MADLNNNLNVGGMHQSYAPGFKAEEKKTPPATPDGQSGQKTPETSLDKDPKAIAGKSQIKTSSVAFKADMEEYMKNPQKAERAMRAADAAYELMNADDIADAYEKSCSGAIDAAYGN